MLAGAQGVNQEAAHSPTPARLSGPLARAAHPSDPESAGSSQLEKAHILANDGTFYGKVLPQVRGFINITASLRTYLGKPIAPSLWQVYPGEPLPRCQEQSSCGQRTQELGLSGSISMWQDRGGHFTEGGERLAAHRVCSVHLQALCRASNHPLMSMN